MKTGAIYVIRSRVLDRPIYVGQTRQNPALRWEQHRTRRTKLAQHIREVGVENFIFEVLETVDMAEIDAREAHWVVALNTSHPAGWNLRKGGANGGFSSLAKARVAEASKAAWRDPEYRKRQVEKRRQAWADPEYRERMAAKRREMWADPEFKAKMKAKQVVAQNRPELREAQADMMRAKWAEPEFKASTSAAISRGRKQLTT